MGGVNKILSGGILGKMGILSDDTPGEGKSAKQLDKEAQVKADKENTARRAAMERNKTSLVDNEESTPAGIPSVTRSIFNKKKLG